MEGVAMDKWLRIGQGRTAHVAEKYRDTVRLTVYELGRGGLTVVIFDRIFTLRRFIQFFDSKMGGDTP